MPRVARLRSSRELLRAELHAHVDRVFDLDETACFEVVKANEHLEFYEYKSRRTPLRERVRHIIFAYSDEPRRRRAGS